MIPTHFYANKVSNAMIPTYSRGSQVRLEIVPNKALSLSLSLSLSHCPSHLNHLDMQGSPTVRPWDLVEPMSFT